MYVWIAIKSDINKPTVMIPYYWPTHIHGSCTFGVKVLADTAIGYHPLLTDAAWFGVDLDGLVRSLRGIYNPKGNTLTLVMDLGHGRRVMVHKLDRVVWEYYSREVGKACGDCHKNTRYVSVNSKPLTGIDAATVATTVAGDVKVVTTAKKTPKTASLAALPLADVMFEGAHCEHEHDPSDCKNVQKLVALMNTDEIGVSGAALHTWRGREMPGLAFSDMKTGQLRFMLWFMPEFNISGAPTIATAPTEAATIGVDSKAPAVAATATAPVLAAVGNAAIPSPTTALEAIQWSNAHSAGYQKMQETGICPCGCGKAMKQDTPDHKSTASGKVTSATSGGAATRKAKKHTTAAKKHAREQAQTAILRTKLLLAKSDSV